VSTLKLLRHVLNLQQLAESAQYVEAAELAERLEDLLLAHPELAQGNTTLGLITRVARSPYDDILLRADELFAHLAEHLAEQTAA
jgi:hypothetical protein